MDKRTEQLKPLDAPCIEGCIYENNNTCFGVAEEKRDS